MKKFILCITLLSLTGAACTSTPSPTNESATGSKPQTLTIYAYDSLVAEYGLLPAIQKEFEDQYNAKLELVSFPDTGTMLQQVLQEQTNPSADVVLGLDNVNFIDVQTAHVLTPYTPQRATEIDTDLRFDDAFTMTPFDYGYIGFVYDTEALSFPEPISLTDLTQPEYDDKIIIEQPELSSPGTQLVLWANAVLPADQVDDFWQGLASNTLAVTPDWSSAYYTLFLNGEAPIVLSYLTSPAYHIEYESTRKYAAIPIEEGYVRQIEGVGIVQGTDQLTLAQDFIDYLLSDSAQNTIPTTQWMFPVLGDSSTWPAAYSEIIQPTDDQVTSLSSNTVAQSLDTWLNVWNSSYQVK